MLGTGDAGEISYRPAFEEITVQLERQRTRQIIALLGNML